MSQVCKEKRVMGIAIPSSFKRVGNLSFFAVSDQAIFAGTNFLTSVALARWLSPEEYGAFAVVYTTFLFLSTFYTALWIEPMLVFGGSEYSGNFGSYLRTLGELHWKFGAAAFSAFLAIALGSSLFGNMLLANGFIGAAFMAPLALLTWLLRRACYVNATPNQAAVGSLFYGIILLGGVWILERFSSLGLLSALVCMGSANIPVILFLASKSRETEGNDVPTNEVLKKHWEYGRWGVPGSVFSWVPTKLYFLLLPLWGGLESSGALRALMNLNTPLLSFNLAIGSVFLPSLARARGTQRFRTIFKSLLIALSIPAIGYWVVVGFWGESILLLLYGNVYSEYADLLWWLAFTALFSPV